MSELPQPSARAKDARLLIEARRLAQAGDLEGASKRLRLFVDINQDPSARADGLYELALVRFGARDQAGAIAHLREVVALMPNHLRARTSLGTLLGQDTRYMEEAIMHLEHACALESGDPTRLVDLLFARRRCCQWDGTNSAEQIIQRIAATDPTLVKPFPGLMIGLTPAAQRKSAEWVAASWIPPEGMPSQSPLPAPLDGRRLRVGYLSSDFRNHATSFLLVRVLELHDRSRLEVIGLSIGPDDQSPMRERVVAALDRMVDLDAYDDQRAAVMIAALELDILVDLNGHANLARPSILARRPAPVQAAWLGYPGTIGAPWIDYTIADPIVAPYGVEEDFSEALVRLACYQPNDDRPMLSDTPTPRAKHHLPEGAVVFACFNQPVKITPAVFASWMRILHEVPESVLWLLEMGGPAARNLGKAAEAVGMSPQRLVFAPAWPHEDHVQRLTHADIVLDTRPYNAHTTASDALWMGIPVITWPEERCFQGRVAASLLTNVGLEDLIATDGDAYERLAISLAQDGERRAALRAHLLGPGRRSRLFDAAAHARELETAYERMIQRRLRGQPPISFDVF